MKYKKIITYSFIFCLFYNCSPKLKVYEIEQKLNENHEALFKGDIEALLKNIPKRYMIEQGEDNLRKVLVKRYSNVKYPIRNSEISNLNILDKGKCNSFYYYKVNFISDKSQITPYLDSIALKLNEEKYGREHVSFNPNSKILQIREKKTKILVLDKDKNWKILNLDGQSLSENYGEKFWFCIEKEYSKE